MLESHGKFHSANGKRLVLVVDDEPINREMLMAILEDEYDLISAENGGEALEKMREYQNDLSLVLLDLQMPVMSGFEVLERAKADAEIAQIPIVVLTADQDAEVESLTIGANDFIPKPYPRRGVMLARIRKTIELSEDRTIIQSTERDSLTGLYNRDYFYRYAEQYDQHHKDVDMDAVVVDVNHFHMINERFGTARGDEVLKRIASALREEVGGLGGIVCRHEADVFLAYCPHGLDYTALLEGVTAKASAGDSGDTHVWLRMGVYENVDKSMEVERRFSRAKIAANTVQGSFVTQIGVYDDELNKLELYQEQLIEDFDTAIKEGQFQVYYQPKFDIKPEIPTLASAEALVRWMHPTLGMISPGVFIPLFERNGLIQGLDTFVWRETAAHIRDWRERFGFAVPVSVNVSRIDMYDPKLVDTLTGILAENDLAPKELLLEITESAYTEDSGQIVDIVNTLRNLGFKVEMDDFGSGYSSLNMISTLPIDALKMDMEFIRNAFSEGSDTKMLEVVIDIADHLSIPVIAEGVETEEQMLTLREMGCDFVQGYYFSRPVPADEYEKFVAERKRVNDVRERHYEAVFGYSDIGSDFPLGSITHALSGGFEIIYYVDTQSEHYVKFTSLGERDDLQIVNSGADFFGDALRQALGTVWEGDAMRVDLSLRKEALLSQLAGGAPFFMTYRKDEDGVPVFYNMEVAKALTHDEHHIVVGIRNVDDEHREADAERAAREMDYSKFVRALACDLEDVFYVDPDAGLYTEFKVLSRQGEIEVVGSGSDFFAERVPGIVQLAASDDRPSVASALGREALVDVLSKRSSFSGSYRLASDGGASGAPAGPAAPAFNLKVVWADAKDRRHIIIGLSSTR